MTTYTTEASNHRAVTSTKNPTYATEGNSRVSSATVAVLAADADGKILHMLPIHSSWSVKAIRCYNDAITSGTSYDLGLYSNASTPAVVDVDAYASAVDMSSARTASPVDLSFEARNITSINQRVWQDAGLTADPGVWYLLSFTANTVGTADGDITIVLEYTE